MYNAHGDMHLFSKDFRSLEVIREANCVTVVGNRSKKMEGKRGM